MLVGLCTLAVVVLVTVVAGMPEPAPAGLRGRSRSGRSRRPRTLRPASVDPAAAGLDPAGFDPSGFDPGSVDHGLAVAAETTPVVRPASPPPGDLDLSGFDRLPRILGPARLSELQPGSDEWRW